MPRTKLFAFLLFLSLSFSASVLAQAPEDVKAATNIVPSQTVVATKPPPVPADNTDANRRQRVYLAGLMAGLLAIAVWYLRSNSKAARANTSRN